jgi:putative lysine transport system substrate-binding protein
MLKKKISLLLLAALTVMLVFAGCGTKVDKEQAGSQDNSAAQESETQNDATPTASAPDTFKVGMECAYPPFNWTQMDDSNGAVPIDGAAEFAGGYDIEIAKKIADGLGKQLVVVKTEWDGLIPALLSGKIDAIIAGMSPTAERKETIDFTDN